MVIKGTSCAGAARIAKHLSCTETNEHNELHELRGVAAEDLYGALREMEAVALGSRATCPFYHASINTPAHERLTDEQRAQKEQQLNDAWNKLSLESKIRIMRLHRALNQMPPEERKFIRDRVERFLNMSAEERERMRSNIERWQKMTPEERQLAREQFRQQRKQFEEKWRREHPDEPPPPFPFHSQPKAPPPPPPAPVPESTD